MDKETLKKEIAERQARMHKKIDIQEERLKNLDIRIVRINELFDELRGASYRKETCLPISKRINMNKEQL